MSAVAVVTTAKRAAIYRRVSTKKQEDNWSLEDQETRCRGWCAEHGYTVEPQHLYTDVDEGDDYYGRPAFTAMRQAMMRGEFDAIVFRERDRLVTRGGPKHLYTLQTECEEYDVRLLSVLDPLPEPEDEDAELVEYITARQHRQEKKRIRQKTQNGRLNRVQAGKMIAGCVPLFGFAWVNPDAKDSKDRKTGYTPDPETWPVVARIRQDGLSGVTTRQIAKRLTAEGVKTPSRVLWERGQLPKNRTPTDAWSRAMIAKVLTHPAYAGEFAAYRYRAVRRKERDRYTGERRQVKTMELRDAGDPAIMALPAACPAIGAPEIAAALRERLTRNKAEASRHLRDPESALLRNGYATCGHCGANLSTRTVRKSAGVENGIRIYYCPRRFDGTPCPAGPSITVAKLDGAVWDQVSAWLADEAAFGQLLADWRTQGHQTEDQHVANLKANEGALARLRAKAHNLAASIAEATSAETRTLLTHLLDEVTRDQRDLLAQQDELRAAAADHAAHVAEVEQVADWLATAQARLPLFTYQDKRATLWAFGIHAQVWRRDHDPQFRITFGWDGLKAGVPVTPQTEEAATWQTQPSQPTELPAASRAILPTSSGSCSSSTSSIISTATFSWVCNPTSRHPSIWTTPSWDLR